MLHDSMDTLSATELNPQLKWSILCYLYFITVLQRKKIHCQVRGHLCLRPEGTACVRVRQQGAILLPQPCGPRLAPPHPQQWAPRHGGCGRWPGMLALGGGCLSGGQDCLPADSTGVHCSPSGHCLAGTTKQPPSLERAAQPKPHTVLGVQDELDLTPPPGAHRTVSERSHHAECWMGLATVSVHPEESPVAGLSCISLNPGCVAACHKSLRSVSCSLSCRPHPLGLFLGSGLCPELSACLSATASLQVLLLKNTASLCPSDFHFYFKMSLLNPIKQKYIPLWIFTEIKRMDLFDENILIHKHGISLY